MNLFTKLFGDCGRIRFEGETDDGKKFTGKMYIESFNNSVEDVEEHIKNIIYVEEGIRCKTVKIIGFVET